ncbi:hypothetical protein [Flexithrix dorotheae]|uniref:hypothetical protein n=1 Tax=Flexithrix dorotheae TaxID=70993 RepID=UPI000381882F|nr:hypothetical protein [Flexithrix dorotheae]
MKKLIATISLLVFIYFLNGCNPQGKSGDENVQVAAMSEEKDLQHVAGTWKLRKYKYGTDSIYSEWPDDLMTKIKLITDSHFTWVSYDEKNVIGSGGGTYAFDGANYIEHIHFFEDEEVDLTGTSAHFQVRFDGKTLYQSGYTKEYEIDPETLEYVLKDSTWLEEIWERI